MTNPIENKRFTYKVDLDNDGTQDELSINCQGDKLTVSVEMNKKSSGAYLLHSETINDSLCYHPNYQPQLLFRQRDTSGHIQLDLPTGKRIDLEDLYSQMKEAVQFHKKMEVELVKIEQLRSDLVDNFRRDPFETSMQRLQELSNTISYVGGLTRAYKDFAPNPKLKEVAEEIWKKVNLISSKTYFDGGTDETGKVYGLYGAVKTMWNAANQKDAVDPRIKRILEIHLARFEKNKANQAQTVGNRQQQLKDVERILKDIADAQLVLLDETKFPDEGYKISLDQLQKMNFIDADVKREFIEKAKKTGNVLTVPYNYNNPDKNTASQLMRSCDDEATLKNFHDGQVNYFNKQSGADLIKLVEKKNELAKILGYKNALAYELPVDHIISSEEELNKFLADSARELESYFSPIATRIGANPKTLLLPHLDNLSERKVEKLNQFNPDQDFLPYLGYKDVEEHTLNSMRADLKTVDKSIEMTPMKPDEISKDKVLNVLYSADPEHIKMFKIIRTSDHEDLDTLVFDPYQRANKNVGNAALYPILIPNGKKMRLITIVSNTIPLDDKGHIDTDYRFSNNMHEWGHCLNYILSGPGFGLIDPTLFSYPESDALEPIQSRFTEERTYDKITPTHFIHYQTRQPMAAHLQKRWQDFGESAYGPFYIGRILRNGEISQTFAEGKIVGDAAIQAGLAANYQENAYQYSLGLFYTAKVMKMYKVFEAKRKAKEFDKLIFTHLYQNPVGDPYKKRWKEFVEAVRKVDPSALEGIIL